MQASPEPSGVVLKPMCCASALIARPSVTIAARAAASAIGLGTWSHGALLIRDAEENEAPQGARRGTHHPDFDWEIPHPESAPRNRTAPAAAHHL